MTHQRPGWTVERTPTDGHGRPLNRNGHPIHISAVSPDHWSGHVTWEAARGSDEPGYLYRATAVDGAVQYRYQGTSWHEQFMDAFIRWGVHHFWMPH